MISTQLEQIAHRGFSAIAPENTLIAFEAARQAGADSLEFDLRLSLDGVPVVIHDETLDRTTATPGRVSQTPWEHLQRLDAGAWLNEEFQGAGIPSLEQTLAEVAKFPQFAYLDLKSDAMTSESNWTSDRLDRILEMIQSYQLGDRCFLCSFDSELLAAFREKSPHCRLGYHTLTATDIRQRLPQAAQVQGVLLSLYKPLLGEPGLIDEARSQNVEIVAWTVDDPQLSQQLQQSGINRIISNQIKTPEEIKNQVP